MITTKKTPRNWQHPQQPWPPIPAKVVRCSNHVLLYDLLLCLWSTLWIVCSECGRIEEPVEVEVGGCNKWVRNLEECGVWKKGVGRRSWGLDLGIEWEVMPRTATDLLKGKLDCQEIDGVVGWWSCGEAGRELAELYESVGMEGVRDGGYKLNGMHYPQCSGEMELHFLV